MDERHRFGLPPSILRELEAKHTSVIATQAMQAAFASFRLVQTCRFKSTTPLCVRMCSTSSSVKVGFLGCGTMGRAIITRLVEKNLLQRSNAYASARTGATLEKLRHLGLPQNHLLYGEHANQRLVQESDVIVLGVKPQVGLDVLTEIAPYFDASRHLLISLLAGMSTANQMKALQKQNARIVRVIPTPAAYIGESCTVAVAGPNVTEQDIQQVTNFFNACGSVEMLDSEQLLDAATACILPVYTYLALEAIADAAVLEGIPRAVARRLAADSVRSAASLAAADPSTHPAVVRNNAESPAGVTIRATRELERGGFRASIMNAFAEATQRSKDLNN